MVDDRRNYKELRWEFESLKRCWLCEYVISLGTSEVSRPWPEFAVLAYVLKQNFVIVPVVS